MQGTFHRKIFQMFFWIVHCTVYTTLARHASYFGCTEAACRGRGESRGGAPAPGVPAVPKPAVPQLRIVILSGATGSPSQDRFKLPALATRAVTVAGHLKRSGNLNWQADSDSEPAAAADSQLKYFLRGLHWLRGPGPG